MTNTKQVFYNGENITNKTVIYTTTLYTNDNEMKIEQEIEVDDILRHFDIYDQEYKGINNYQYFEGDKFLNDLCFDYQEIWENKLGEQVWFDNTTFELN